MSIEHRALERRTTKRGAFGKIERIVIAARRVRGWPICWLPSLSTLSSDVTLLIKGSNGCREQDWNRERKFQSGKQTG